jgi:hypothetical protein
MQWSLVKMTAVQLKALGYRLPRMNVEQAERATVERKMPALLHSERRNPPRLTA